VVKFAIFIVVMNIGFIVLADMMVEVRNLILKMIWGRKKFEVYRTWEKTRSRNLRQAQKVGLQVDPSKESDTPSINSNPESVKGPLFSTLITTIILIIIQGYLMVRFTLFYHGFTGYQFLPLIFAASIISLIFHLSARHGWLMVSLLLSSYLLLGAILYK
jgi:flagellar biogenesis protein FliO